MNLKAELEHLMPSVEPSPWRGHEHVRGYGVFGLPLSSGHSFALRVFPINDFAPYVTVWHLAPDGTWSIHYQAPRPDIACPRYCGAAARIIGHGPSWGCLIRNAAHRVATRKKRAGRQRNRTKVREKPRPCYRRIAAHFAEGFKQRPCCDPCERGRFCHARAPGA